MMTARKACAVHNARRVAPPRQCQADGGAGRPAAIVRREGEPTPDSQAPGRYFRRQSGSCLSSCCGMLAPSSSHPHRRPPVQRHRPPVSLNFFKEVALPPPFAYRLPSRPRDPGPRHNTQTRQTPSRRTQMSVARRRTTPTNSTGNLQKQTHNASAPALTGGNHASAVVHAATRRRLPQPPPSCRRPAIISPVFSNQHRHDDVGGSQRKDVHAFAAPR